ncbi:hypothetical protein ACQ7CX_04175 [Chryseobacterium arthrosphaerae]|uniref:hypothetical protein n=1 Tax=Chryseobacterium arthrosphaerae TaxID=651561 RepID=UPI001BB02747|nr:hypothetical protein [Chryseobacterium arthrosphaerae]QUY57843.1 hypothetical protein I2F65_11095 [Chryseobacterium arthrosphaerae]
MQNKPFKQYFFLSIIFFSSCLFSQSRKLNLIILNDQEISKSIFDFKITAINNNSLNESITGKYIPGDLIIESKDFDRLLSSDNKDFEMSFTAISTVNPDLVKEFKYSIMIPKIYLNYDYLIINIFNMYNKNSRKKYSKLIKNNKEYYVVIETPNSMKFD